MTPPDENGFSGQDAARRNGAQPPFGTTAPFGTTTPFGTTAPFGTTVPFATGAPFTMSPFSANGYDGGQFNSVGKDLFTDPRAVIKKALLIVRSRWLTGVCAGLLVAGGLGAILLRFRPIEAVAETTLVAESPLDQILNPSGVSPADAENQENSLTNHLSVMMSRTFRQQLAASFTPAESDAIQQPYLKKGQVPTPAILNSVLAKKITVDREKEKEFFTIDVHHVSPDVALMVANRFTATYLALVQSEVHRANLTADSILTKQAAALTAEISTIEDERRAYRQEHNLISAEENQVMLEDRIKEVNLARSDLRVQRAKLEAQVNQARQDMASNPLPFSNSILAAYGGTPVLRQQLDALELQRDVLAIKYGPKHSKMLEVQGSIDATKAALTRNFQQAFDDLQSQLALAINSERNLNVEFDTAFKESLELSRLADRLNTLGQQADNKRKTLDDLMQRIGKARIDTGLPADVLRVIDPAGLKRPLVPMLAIYIAVVGMFGLCAFAGAPILINFFDERINENIDVEGRLRLDVIGVVPRLSRTRKEDRPHIVRDSANLVYAESFLTLASQIDLVSKKPIPRRILVTSTLPGEGKSTLASNLATAYTRLGRRTVLVDCDFRKPSQRTMHKIGGSTGLLPWARAGFQIGPGLLEPGGAVDATVLKDGTVLIPAGASETQPARYLIAEGMGRFFALLRQEFEIVIIDTPPAGVFQDALILARHCDDTVFVARDGKANTSQLTRIIQDFARTSSPAVGIVLNGFSTNASHPQFGHRQLYHKYAYYGSPARSVGGEKR